jgi:hypothetical protein
VAQHSQPAHSGMSGFTSSSSRSDVCVCVNPRWRSATCEPWDPRRHYPATFIYTKITPVKAERRVTGVCPASRLSDNTWVSDWVSDAVICLSVQCQCITPYRSVSLHCPWLYTSLTRFYAPHLSLPEVRNSFAGNAVRLSCYRTLPYLTTRDASTAHDNSPAVVPAY